MMCVTRGEKRIGMSAHFRDAGIRASRALLLAGMLVLAGFICGCSGVVSGQSTRPATQTPATQTYSISGTITPSSGGSGATIALSGAASGTTTADSSGNYSFTGLANGTFAVTPSNAGFAFSPTSQVATVNGANVTGLNFAATAQVGPTYSISGTITPSSGGNGATITLSGAASAATTPNSAGNYTFTGLANGNYAVTPSNRGFAFSPSSQNAMVNGANVSGVDFAAAPQQTHSVALSWNASTSTVSGYYIYRSTLIGGSYLRINSSPVPGLSYTDSTVQNGTTYYYATTAVDSTGTESIFSNLVSAVIP
jgi:SdrD B-like domain